MKQKLVLTSIIALGFIAQAGAEPTNTGSFPSGGLMQADYTYTNAATSTNMAGVYEGEVNAEAQYENILYTIGAGQYLPAGGESVISCNIPGSFCPGLQSQVTYDAQNNQGLTSCSTATNGAYTSSDGTGSTADSCYRQCSGNVTITHATGVTGNDYYGNGTDTCEPTGCENGWHIHRMNLSTIIGLTESCEASAHINNDNNYYNIATSQTGKNYNRAYYGISDSDTWAIDYGDNKGIVYGLGRCSTQPGNAAWSQNPVTTFSELTDEANQTGATKCYCNVIGYKSSSESEMQPLSSLWVYRDYHQNEEQCASQCTYYCARYLGENGDRALAYRTALFGTVASFGLASCEANTITINWTGTTETEINANNAGTATYGSDVRTPRSATPVPGKTFTGWRFVAPEQASVSEP